MIDITPNELPIIPVKEKIVLPISFRDGIDNGSGKPDENATNSQTFYDNSAPTGDYNAGDIWVDTDDDNHTYRANEDKDWVSIRDGSIVAAAGTANWSEVVDDDTNKPESNADKTSENQGDVNTSNVVNGAGWTDDTVASAAASAASDAQDDADTANGLLTDIALDTKITAVEKLTIKPMWDDIVVEGTATTGTIPAQAIVFSVSHTNFDTAYAALYLYINTTTSVFGNMATTTTITRADWDTAWKNYYNQRTLILNAIATAAKTLADSAQGTADIRITTFIQSAIPTSLAAGDLFIDTDDGKMYRATGIGDTTIEAGKWIRIDIGLYPGLVDSLETTNAPAVAGATDDSAANLRVTTFYQSAIPTSLAAGDMWLDSDDGKLYRATGIGDTTIEAGKWIRIDTGLYPGLIDALSTTNGPAAANADVTKTIIDAGMITTGYITLGTAGHIKSGQTAYETGTGFWLGDDGGTPKFSIGNTTDYLKWTGSAVSMLCSGANAIIIDYGSDILLKEGGDVKFTSVTKPTACSGALAGDGVGNVDDGTHSYKITYVNASGETELGAVSNTVTVADKSSNGKIDLTSIPVSTSGSVTSRKIYRTKAGGISYYLLDTIADNTTTTYEDNIADASLTGDGANDRENSASGTLYLDNISIIHITAKNDFLGEYSGIKITTGIDNTGVGRYSLWSNNSGKNNVAIGSNAMTNNTLGNYNVGIGVTALLTQVDGTYNVGVGHGALISNSGGDYNTAIGAAAGFKSTGDSNVFLGHKAGYNETGSNKLFIDNTNRTNEADGRVKALVYGEFNATALSQQITFNVGTLNILDGGNIVTGTGIGLKIGTATAQKIGFYNATPVNQPDTIADATDAASVILRCNDIIDRLQELGLIA